MRYIKEYVVLLVFHFISYLAITSSDTCVN